MTPRPAVQPTILLAPTLELARSLGPASVSVEAEYGGVVVEGYRYTAAHHTESHRGNPPPCVDFHIPTVREGEVILVSHLDLDTLGGVLRAMGQLDLLGPRAAGFWDLAAFVDVHGPHHLPMAKARPRDVAALQAWWAWSKEGIPRFPRDKVSDITEDITRAARALQGILEGDQELLLAGEKFAREEKALNLRTFTRKEGPVIVRLAGACGDFCNHLYQTPGGQAGEAVACFNRETGAVTVSLAQPTSGVSCRELVQSLWGPEAGGHPGIAGSPRGRLMSEGELERAIQTLSSLLQRQEE